MIYYWSDGSICWDTEPTQTHSHRTLENIPYWLVALHGCCFILFKISDFSQILIYWLNLRIAGRLVFSILHGERRLGEIRWNIIIIICGVIHNNIFSHTPFRWTIKDLSVIKVLLIISNVLLISITLSVKQPELESNLNTHTHTEKWMTWLHSQCELKIKTSSKMHETLPSD